MLFCFVFVFFTLRYCSSLPPRALRQRSCYPVVRRCSNWQARPHSCTTRHQPESLGEQEHVCLCCAPEQPRARAHAHGTQMPCSCSLSLSKHGSAKHALTLDFAQTQRTVQESLTAALNYFNYRGPKKKTHSHTLSSHWLQPSSTTY